MKSINNFKTNARAAPVALLFLFDALI